MRELVAECGAKVRASATLAVSAFDRRGNLVRIPTIEPCAGDEVRSRLIPASCSAGERVVVADGEVPAFCARLVDIDVRCVAVDEEHVGEVDYGNSRDCSGKP